MRELGRVFANEWMKLMSRWRLWVVVGLAVLVVTGLSYMEYRNYESIMKYNSIQGQQNMIKQQEKQIIDLTNQLKSGTSGQKPEDLKNEIEGLKQSIVDMKNHLKQDEQMMHGDWKAIVQKQLDDVNQQINHPAPPPPGQTQSPMDTGYLKMQQMQLQYELKQSERPLLDWEGDPYSKTENMLKMVAIVFLPMLVVVLVSDMVSSETTRGTIKLLLVRPVSRVKILLGKWLVSLVATTLLVLITYGALVGVNVALYGNKGVNAPEFVGVTYTYQMTNYGQVGAPMQEQAIPHYDHASIVPKWKFIAMGCLFSIFSMMAVASIAFLFSTLFKSVMVSTAVSLSLIVVGSIVTQMVRNGKWLGWLFFTHLDLLDNWTGHLSEAFKADLSLTTGVITLSVWTIVSIIVATIYFKRKDVLNA